MNSGGCAQRIAPPAARAWNAAASQDAGEIIVPQTLPRSEYNITITIENQNVKGKVIPRKESRPDVR